MSTSRRLHSALSELVEVARKAGLDPEVAMAEGRQIAASVAEPARGAFLDWAEALDELPNARAFFETAAAGRRWRNAPTPLVSQLRHADPIAAGAYAAALADVAFAATSLGETHPQVSENAGLTAAAQRRDPLGGTVRRGAPRTPESNLEEVANDVLSRLRASEQRMRELGLQGSGERRPTRPLDLTGVDPSTPGAFPGFNEAFPDLVLPPPARREPVHPSSGDEPRPSRRWPEPRWSDSRWNSPDPTETPEPEHEEPQPVLPVPPAPEETTPAQPPEGEAPAEGERTLEDLLEELDRLVGLAGVKAEIHRQAAILRVEGLRRQAGLRSPTITRHLVFVGNPGTGKTTVARLVAGIYKALGLLSQGQLVEVDRSSLVAGFLGQTAIKTSEIVATAAGGVLFVDEAYSLNGDQYGEEAINTLVKEMEDRRDDLVVIVAGYPAPMTSFIDNNPGLSSRFRTTITFENYSDEELVAIFRHLAEQADYDLGPEVPTAFQRILAAQNRDDTFGNGRFARNVLEAAIGRHAWRLRDVVDPSVDDLRTLVVEDLQPDASASSVTNDQDDEVSLEQEPWASQ